MGAWGIQTFEDDECLDWLFDLADQAQPVAFFRECLDLDGLEELEKPAGVGVLGSAVMIDGLLHGPTKDLPEEAVAWLETHSKLKVEKLVPRAVAGLERLLEDNSEMHELWRENRALYPKWKRRIVALKNRLQRKRVAPARATVIRTERPPRKKSTTHFKAGDVFTYQLTSRTRVRMCVLKVWGDMGGTYADVSLLGLDDGKSFTRNRLKSQDFVGVNYTMVDHEPDDRIVILRRGVTLPSHIPKVFLTPNGVRIAGHASTWKDFPEVLGKMIRKLKWTKPKTTV